jgi:hypothetical protein
LVRTLDILLRNIAESSANGGALAPLLGRGVLAGAGLLAGGIAGLAGVAEQYLGVAAQGELSLDAMHPVLQSPELAAPGEVTSR